MEGLANEKRTRKVEINAKEKKENRKDLGEYSCKCVRRSASDLVKKVP